MFAYVAAKGQLCSSTHTHTSLPYAARPYGRLSKSKGKGKQRQPQESSNNIEIFCHPFRAHRRAARRVAHDAAAPAPAWASLVARNIIANVAYERRFSFMQNGGCGACGGGGAAEIDTNCNSRVAQYWKAIGSAHKYC